MTILIKFFPESCYDYVEVTMPKSYKSILFWAPRIISILFILFLSLFALDVFGQGYGFWETVQALFMHLLPSLLLVAALLLAWRWEWIIWVSVFGTWLQCGVDSTGLCIWWLRACRFWLGLFFWQDGSTRGRYGLNDLRSDLFCRS